MAVETTRETNMLRIYNPNNHHEFVDVKVIRNIHFKDPSEGNQEYVYRFNNQQNGSGNDNQRKTRLKEVTGSDHVSKVEVERIKVWGVTNPQDNNQQTGFRMIPDFSDDDPPVPFKYHDKKIHNPNNHDLWVVMRRRDYTHFLDPKAGPSGNDTAIPASGAVGTDQTGGWASQDKYFKLTWADDDEDNPDQEVDKGHSGGDVNGPHGPFRFDPFQDLIDVHWGGHGHLPHHHEPTGFCNFYPCCCGIGVLFLNAEDMQGAGQTLCGQTNPGGGDNGNPWDASGCIGVSPGDTLLFAPGCPDHSCFPPAGAGCCGANVPGGVPRGSAEGCEVPVPDNASFGITSGPPVTAFWVASWGYCELCTSTCGFGIPAGFSPATIFGAVGAAVGNVQKR